MKNVHIFALGGMRDLVYNQLSPHIEIRHPDGEAYTQSNDNVRGSDVYVLSDLYTDETYLESVDERFMKTSLFINSLHHASANRITLVAPYLCYSRQDRKTESRAPIGTQTIAVMLEAVGVDRLLTMDVHNLSAVQNAYRIPVDNLEAKKPLADRLARDFKEIENLCIVSPDVGGFGRANAMQIALEKRLGREIPLVCSHKTRYGNSVKIKLIGDVSGRKAIIVDDMISTGLTISKVQDVIHAENGECVAVAATHGYFVGGYKYNLQRIPNIYITDTVIRQNTHDDFNGRLHIVSVFFLFAEAIRRISNETGSISQLLNDS